MRTLLEQARARGVARVEEVTLRVPVLATSSNSDALTRRHRTLSEEYAAYLCDPRDVLARPALSDVTDPFTAEFVEAYADLTALSPVSPGYEDALERAWKGWRAASRNARKLGLKRLSTQERRRITTAQRLLELALSPGATDAERHQAYAQVEKLVAGLVSLPAEARVAITGRRSIEPA